MEASRGTTSVSTSQRPVRGTQLLVEHMGEILRQPSLIGIEIAWRWIAAIPIALVCWIEAKGILAAYPLTSSGFSTIDAQNPWLAAQQLAGVWTYYIPHVLAVLRWILPAAAVFWIVIAGIGRNLLLIRMDRSVPFRPLAMTGLQVGWMVLLAITFWGWFRSVGWAAATHIATTGEPDLVGYAMWTIWLIL